jgi:predicted dehydrogenase
VPIRVGIIGANPDIGWASQTHLPIVDALPEFELAAVATTRPESAEAAASRYGANRFYTDPAALISDPDVELVTISVKCPDHKDLVHRALDSGKHVYCEWPLASSARDADELYAHAQRVDGHCVIGLQAMAAPAMRHARDLIAAGAIGTVESVVARYIVSTGKPERSARHRYLFDPAAGAGVLGIHTGHALSGALMMIGAPTSVSASMQTRNPRLRIVETGEFFDTTEPDHIAMTGVTDENVMLIGEVHYSHYRDPFSKLEILGSEGALRIATRPWPPPSHERVSFQTGDLHLYATRDGELSFEEIEIPTSYGAAPSGIPDQGRNVAQLYALLARDLEEGTHTAPDFGVAVRMHHVLAAIDVAARSTVKVV